MMKKGQVSFQLNWVFVIIIGVIILTFFISVVSKQKEVSDNKISASVAKSFETLF